MRSNSCFLNSLSDKFFGNDAIIGKEDLILSKLNWAKNTESEMQMRDVASILRNGYDENYVQTWAEKLGVMDLLDKCLEMIEENYVEGYDS